MLTILALVIFIGAVCWAVKRLLVAFEVPDPIATLIWVTVVLLGIWLLLGVLHVVPRVTPYL